MFFPLQNTTRGEGVFCTQARPLLVQFSRMGNGNPVSVAIEAQILVVL